MRNVKRSMLAALAVAVTLGAPSAASARQGGPEPDIEKARALSAQAEELLSQPKHWRRAARLLEESAELRGAADPEAYENLLFAGRLRASDGDYVGAKAALERAAEGALARGAVIDAAQAFIDAAYAAAKIGEARQAQALVDRAALLARSPLLNEEQRLSITRRLQA